MTNKQLAKLWAAIAAILLFYLINSYLATQGGEPLFDTKLVAKAREPIALFAIIIGAPLLLLSALTAQLYATRSETSESWFGRLPVFWFDAIDVNSPEGRWYQRLTLFIFTILPTLSFIHFFRIVIAADVCASKPVAHPSGAWDWSALKSINDPARLGGVLTQVQGSAPSCDNGTTFFPFVEPLLLLIWICVAYWAVYRQLRAIYFP